MRTRTGSRSTARNAAGFSLLELIIGLVIATEIIIAILTLFDFNNRIASVQTQLAEAQQALRVGQAEITRALHLAGRGALPGIVAPSPSAQIVPAVRDLHRFSIRIQDSVPPSARLVPGSGTSPAILPGSDVLTVRGVFSTPLYFRNYFDKTTLVRGADGHWVLELSGTTPTNIPQDLAPWQDAIDNSRREAVLFVSGVDQAMFAVLEFSPADSSVDLVAGTATLHFAAAGSALTVAYARLNSPPPHAMTVLDPLDASLRNAANIGILEEYRYYIHDQLADGGAPFAPNTRRAPRLARARFFPGTEIPYANDAANLKQDLADNVYDLQLAISGDLNADGTVFEGPAPTTGDEWLFNHPDDLATVGNWMTILPGASEPAALSTVRLTQLATTERGDPRYVAAEIVRVENHDYGATDLLNSPALAHRTLRRRVLQTLIDPRNF